jgi:hypothetical protein
MAQCWEIGFELISAWFPLTSLSSFLGKGRILHEVITPGKRGNMPGFWNVVGVQEMTRVSSLRVDSCLSPFYITPWTSHESAMAGQQDPRVPILEA